MIPVMTGAGILGRRRLWVALPENIRQGAASATIAARFNQGLVLSVAESARELCLQNGLDTVVPADGIFQNRSILEGISTRLGEEGVSIP